MSWDARTLRWTTFGVWVGSRQRWARIPGTRAMATFQKLQSAIEAAEWYQADYPEERFYASGMPDEPLDRRARWTPQQVENSKAYWSNQKRKGEEGGA